MLRLADKAINLRPSVDKELWRPLPPKMNEWAGKRVEIVFCGRVYGGGRAVDDQLSVEGLKKFPKGLPGNHISSKVPRGPWLRRVPLLQKAPRSPSRTVTWA